MDTIRVLVVGCGNMGTSHARAYNNMDEFTIVGLVSRKPASRERLSEELGGLPTFSNFSEALQITKPDAVAISTYPDTHAPFIKQSLEANAHVFVEKPLATTVEEAEELVALASAKNRKIVVGYILRVHPAWSKFVEIAKDLGKPLVMRMNLNQQSSGNEWNTHKQLMRSMSLIVECGVHYVGSMCLITGAKPVSVSAIGARLTEEIAEEMYNYGQLQVRFSDGSVGWYEAGWGPMISETSFFIKDVIGPKGCVSIKDEDKNKSDSVEEHTKTGGLLLHRSSLDANGSFVEEDTVISTENEPDHDALCALEQEFFLEAIQGDKDISDHLQDAINSLKIVLAADLSFKTEKTVKL